MSPQRIVIQMEFPYPVAQVFAFLAAHENQPRILGARVERLTDGEGHKDGVGSSRRMTMPPLPSWDETVTAFEANRRIEYRITRGGPIRGHRGVLVYSPAGEGGKGTRLEYTVTFEPRVPLTGGILRRLTEKNLRKGLDSLVAAGSLPS